MSIHSQALGENNGAISKDEKLGDSLPWLISQAMCALQKYLVAVPIDEYYSGDEFETKVDDCTITLAKFPPRASQD